jgi:D-lactate dehydrogenase (cytochrome)
MPRPWPCSSVCSALTQGLARHASGRGLTSGASGRGLTNRAFGRARVDDVLLSRLERAASRVTTNASIRDRHGDDESHHASVPPECVVYAGSTEEVQAVVRLCAEGRTPLISFGTGTSLEGHIQAVEGGVCLDVSEMAQARCPPSAMCMPPYPRPHDAWTVAQVLEVNQEDMDCRVQAGVTRLALNDHLRGSGLTFPVDPGADASLGGMVATGASGTNSVKYAASTRTRSIGSCEPTAASLSLPQRL